MKTIKNIISSIIGIIGCTVFIFILWNFISDKPPLGEFLGEKWKEQRKEYPDIVKSAKEFRGKIIHRFKTGYVRGTDLFELSNGDKFNLSGVTRNYTYKQSDIREYFMNIGDSIYKPANTDSIYVYSKGKEYYYILDKVINKKQPDYRKYFNNRKECLCE